MSVQDPKGSSGAPPNPSGNEPEANPENTQPNKPDGNVAYETYLKVLDEAKKAKERLSKLEAESQAKEKERLEKQGEYQKLYEQSMKELNELKEKRKADAATFLHRSISNQVKAEAAKAGCQRIDALEKLVDLGELVSEVDDDFNVKGDALKSFIEKAAKEHDFLFSKAAPTFRDATPAGKPPAPKTLKDELKGAKTQRDLDAILKKHGY